MRRIAAILFKRAPKGYGEILPGVSVQQISNANGIRNTLNLILHTDRGVGPACSPPSSMSSPGSGKIQANGQKPTSERFSSTDPFLSTGILALLLRGADNPRGSSQPWTFQTRACSPRCCQHSSQCRLNRYLRRTGGSVNECCCECQRKFDSLEGWEF